jgi:hypothetical protein
MEATVRSSRLAVGFYVVLQMTISMDAQTTPSGVFRPPGRVFVSLFAGDQRPPARATPVAQPTALRERRANRQCEGCEDRPGDTHVIIDSPLLTDLWIGQHTYGANAGVFGDNVIAADFWYDAVHRRIFSRSAVFHEVDDPADVRLGRAPGRFPNAPDFTASLGDGVTVGQVGFETWTRNGYGAYFAAVQGAIRDEGTGYLDLTTAMGRAGQTRTGSRHDPGDLVRHVRLHPTGQLEVGYETDPDVVPDPLLAVHGNAHLDGGLAVNGALTLAATGGNVPHACRLQQVDVQGSRVMATCEPGQLAISGGGTCGSGELKGSRPVQSGSMVDAWEITCGKAGRQIVYVICCAQ